MRDFHLFAVTDNSKESSLEVSAIHNAEGYQQIRQLLSAQYNLSQLEPNIQVQQVNLNTDRALTLRYIPHQEIPLGGAIEQVMRHLHRLWGFEVRLEQLQSDGSVQLLARCPEPA